VKFQSGGEQRLYTGDISQSVTHGGRTFLSRIPGGTFTAQ
jgi:hypothetical protein